MLWNAKFDQLNLKKKNDRNEMIFSHVILENQENTKQKLFKTMNFTLMLTINSTLSTKNKNFNNSSHLTLDIHSFPYYLEQNQAPLFTLDCSFNLYFLEKLKKKISLIFPHFIILCFKV